MWSSIGPTSLRPGGRLGHGGVGGTTAAAGPMTVGGCMGAVCCAGGVCCTGGVWPWTSARPATATVASTVVKRRVMRRTAVLLDGSRWLDVSLRKLNATHLHG